MHEDGARDGHRSWDTVFYVKDAALNIGIRVYYFVNPDSGTIEYRDQIKEFGDLQSSYADNPSKGDLTELEYQFKVVVSEPYVRDGSPPQKCIDVRVDAFQKTTIKTPASTLSSTAMIDDGNDHAATLCVGCGGSGGQAGRG